MSNPNDNPWSEREKTILDLRWREGVKTTRLPDHLPGRSKSACCGQAKRMGLPGRPSPIKGKDGQPVTNKGGRRGKYS